MKHFDSPRINFGEERLLSLFKPLGENVKTWGGDTKENYLTGPWKRGDNIQKITGPVAAAAATLFELPDYLYAGVVDQNVKPASGIAGRVRRDTGLLLKDIVTLHPLRAGGDAFRLVFNDVPMDSIDLIGGFRRNER